MVGLLAPPGASVLLTQFVHLIVDLEMWADLLGFRVPVSFSLHHLYPHSSIPLHQHPIH